jgi:tripartite-type tricarboxylate transporter receptor subunit TctC
LPALPTVSEFVPGYEVSSWFGIGLPRDTSPDIVDTLNVAVNTGLADPMLKARIADLGAVPMPMTPAEFGNFVAGEIEKWGKVIRAANIKLEPG